jgi:hypothetical protein
MRLSRLAGLGLAMTTLLACSEADVTEPDRPALAGVRLINALSDTNAVDIRMVDQLEWSAFANNLAFRAGTQHQPTEAGKARQIRVFAFIPPTNPNNPTVTTQIADTSITFTADSKVTLLLTGSARAGTVRFVMITDDNATVSGNQIAVRAVNAATGAIDGYFLASATDAIAGTPGAANVATLAASGYAVRDTGNVALRVTAAGSATALASTAGPRAPALPAGTGAYPAAGVQSPGTVFSVYYFPAGTAGSPQGALTTPVVVWFVDRVPTTPAS